MKRSGLPLISVIIPTRARPRQLRDCLGALVASGYPRDRFEVIVVDDGGPRPLDGVVEPFRDAVVLKLFRQSNAGPGAARNHGAMNASGDLLAFTDDDCRPAPDWLTMLALRFCEDPERMIGGRTVNSLPDNRYACASQVIVQAAYAHYNRDPGRARFLASNNMAIPAGTFREIGGFDPRFRLASEDRDFCDRWIHAGHSICYAPEAVVLHAHEMRLRGFCRQHFNYGRGAKRYHDARAGRGTGRLADELKFHARFLCLLREPMRGLAPGNALAVGGLLALWQVTNAAGFLYEMCGCGAPDRKPVAAVEELSDDPTCPIPRK